LLLFINEIACFAVTEIKKVSLLGPAAGTKQVSVLGPAAGTKDQVAVLGACSSQPCRNNATCVKNLINKSGYTCLCRNDFKGLNCEIVYVKQSTVVGRYVVQFIPDTIVVGLLDSPSDYKVLGLIPGSTLRGIACSGLSKLAIIRRIETGFGWWSGFRNVGVYNDVLCCSR